MKNQLFKLLGISEEKKNLLFLLYEGPKKREEIIDSMGISRQALMPHLMLMEQNGLITRNYDSKYVLTSVGKLVICEMALFFRKLDFLDSNFDVLKKYKLDFIPPVLLGRLHELGSLNAREQHCLDIGEPDKEFMSNVSTSVYVIIAFLFPSFRNFSSGMMDRGTDMNVIINQEMLEKLITEWNDDFKWFLESERSTVYLYPGKLDFASFGLNESSVMLRLLNAGEGFDHNLITASGQSAVEWGREFFEYYKERSKLITEI